MSSDAAVFLDRDGTLIEDRGFLREESEVVLFPKTISALQRLQKRFRLFIVTNQSGVAKGALALENVNRINAFLLGQLQQAGVTITAVYCCPHQRQDNCACIKPKPFFLDQAVREHGVDLRRSFSIGDHPHDAQFARNGGGRGIFVLTGHGQQHREEARDCVVVRDIGEAANWILAQIGPEQGQQLDDERERGDKEEGRLDRRPPKHEPNQTRSTAKDQRAGRS